MDNEFKPGEKLFFELYLANKKQEEPCVFIEYLWEKRKSRIVVENDRVFIVDTEDLHRPEKLEPGIFLWEKENNRKCMYLDSCIMNGTIYYTVYFFDKEYTDTINFDRFEAYKEQDKKVGYKQFKWGEKLVYTGCGENNLEECIFIKYLNNDRCKINFKKDGIYGEVSITSLIRISNE